MTVITRPIPRSIDFLPVHNGRPVPWFVSWSIKTKQPDFQLVDPMKIGTALKHRLCWTCGEELRHTATFVIGPMGALNRITSEPGNHLECAVYAAQNCPFLLNPNRMRSEGGVRPPHMIDRNPGIVCLWETDGWSLATKKNAILINLGPKLSLQWMTKGRLASRAECKEYVEGSLVELHKIALRSGEIDDLPAIRQRLRRLEEMYPEA
jgi:hypothetical protein